MKKRLIIYPIVVLVAVILLILPGFLTNPQRNLGSIAAITKNSPQQTTHKSFSSYLKQFPGGYVLTFHTGGINSFGATEFVIITKINDALVVDTISGPGPQNAHRLREQDAIDFLKKHEIDLSEFDALINDK